MTRRWGLQIAIAAVLAGGGAAAASAAADGTYKGRTSQRQSVRFTIQSQSVQNFKIFVLDKCPDSHILVVDDMYATMPVKNGKFGGRFAPAHDRHNEKATLRAKIGLRKVTGTVKDASYSSRSHALCHGKARFTARRG